MNYKDFYAGENDKDRRLDKIIRIFVKDISLASVYKYIRKGLIKVNDHKASQEYRVKKGDKLSIADFIISPAEATVSSQKELSFSKEAPFSKKEGKDIKKLPPIVFENEHIIIFNKPINLSVHGRSSLEELYKAYYLKKTENQNSLSFNPGPLHRIDRMTSGLIAFSKSIDGARWFSQAIKNHEIQKKYISIFSGRLEAKCEWNDFIDSEADSSFKNKNSTRGMKEAFHTVKISSEKSGENFKNAKTFVRPLAFGSCEGKAYTLVEVQIKTGRQHQIRAQAAFHGHPLLADTAYQGKESSESGHFFLHAAELLIPEANPLGLPSQIKAPLAEDFQQFLSKTCDIKSFDI